MMNLNSNLSFCKKSLLSALSIIFVFSLFALPVLSFAQSSGGTEGSLLGDEGGTEGTLDEEVNTKLINPIGTNNLNGFIKHILEGAIKIGIPIVALAIIYSGFLYVTAMGNEEKLKSAHKAILYTLIGAVLLIGSWAIAQLISDTVLLL